MKRKPKLSVVPIPALHNKPGIKDPVCGMSVNPQSAANSFEHSGQIYYFCSKHCLEKFRQAPQRFLAGQAKPVDKRETPSGGSREYTCPMHPQVIRDRPGACPICGMTLEPRTVTLEQEESIELKDMTRRFWVSAALTVPLLIVAMGKHLPGVAVEQFASPRMMGALELLLATPIVLWGGWPFFVRAWQSVVNRSLNMFNLDWPWGRSRLRLQRRRRALSEHFSRFVPGCRWRGGCLL